jgi:uncharacterized membrane protein
LSAGAAIKTCRGTKRIQKRSRQIFKLRWILMRLNRSLWVRVVLYAVAGVFAALPAPFSGQIFPGKAPINISSQSIDSLLTIIASSMLAVTTFSVGP